MTEDKDFFQKLSGEMIDFLEWVGDTLGDPLARDAVIRDLGGKPSNVPPPAPLPGDKLDAVKAFRDASHPSAEAAISALDNQPFGGRNLKVNIARERQQGGGVGGQRGGRW